MSKLRDNQALFSEGYGLACEHDSLLPDRFTERVDARKEFVARFLDAVDRHLAQAAPARQLTGRAPARVDSRGPAPTALPEVSCENCAAEGYGINPSCHACGGTGRSTPPRGSLVTTGQALAVECPKCHRSAGKACVVLSDAIPTFGTFCGERIDLAREGAR